MNDHLILVINPGSMTTKVALYLGEEEKAARELEHPAAELSRCASILDQLPLRTQAVLDFVKSTTSLDQIGAIACRGTAFKPLTGGTYRVNEAMIADIREGRLQTPHVSMLAALIGRELAGELGISAYVVDPISVDESNHLAHFTGLPEVPRKSLWHALNCRAVAQRHAASLGKKMTDLNLLVVHLGSGITVATLEKGIAVDCNNANGESPFSPERSGYLPSLEFASYCFDSGLSKSQMFKKLTKESGLMAHLGTSDALAIEKRIAEGDGHARTVYEAMAYGVAKTIGSMATVLKGRVDAILITGALARSARMTGWITERVSFIAPVHLYPGQEEMKALASGVYRVLTGQETEKIFG